MRTFFTIFTIILLCCLPSASAFAETSDLPRIAVYVTGNAPDSKKTKLNAGMLTALIGSGRYIGVEYGNTNTDANTDTDTDANANAFTAAINGEEERSHGSAVDNGRISALGRQSGAAYVCITNIAPITVNNAYLVSARIVDVETSATIASAESQSPLRSASDYIRVSDTLVANMFRVSAITVNMQILAPPEEPIHEVQEPQPLPPPLPPPPIYVPTVDLNSDTVDTAVYNNGLAADTAAHDAVYDVDDTVDTVTVTADVAPDSGDAFTGRFGDSTFASHEVADSVSVNATPVVNNKSNMAMQLFFAKFAETRFGLRAAYNSSNARVTVFENYFDHDIGTRTRNTTSGFGSGFELGLVTNTKLVHFMSFNSGANLVYRNPVTFSALDEEFHASLRIRQIAFAVPVYCRFGGVPAFLDIGLQLDIVPWTKNNITQIDKGNIAPVDLGVILGAMFSLGRYIDTDINIDVDIDFKFLCGLRSFTDMDTQLNRKFFNNKLIQLSCGLTYMFWERKF